MTTAWPEVALGEVCLITMGQAPSGESYNSEGDGWPLISGAGDFHNGLPKAKKFTSVKTKLCEPGDIVLGIRASIGSKVLADKIYCLGRGVAGLRASVDLEERYLWHWLDAVAEDLAAQGRGATFKQVNKNDVAELKIPLPPLDEQRRIAAILDKADEVRSKRKAALETLETLSQAIFIDMFGSDGVGPLETLGKLLESASVFTDGDWVESKDQDPKGSVRLIQLADIGDGFFVDKSARFLTRQKSEELRCTFLKPGDVLVARMPDPLGRACIFPDSPQECVTVVDVCVIRPDGSEIDPVWLTASINSPRFRLQISSFATGTTRSRISRSNLSKLSLRVAPIARQREFAAVIQNLEQAAFALKVSGNGLDNLFFSLQQKAFQGTL